MAVSAALMRHWFQGQPWPTENGGMLQRVLLAATAHNAGVDAVSRGIMQQSMFGMSAQNQRRYIDEQSKRYMLVLNSHFADYRARYKRGGDFRVFSDLLREPLPHGTPSIILPKR